MAVDTGAAAQYNALMNQRRTIEIAKLLAWLAALLCWAVFIFSMSADTGVQSQGLSDRVAQQILGISQPGFAALPDAQQVTLLSQVSYPVRKLAHFSEYVLLGLLALGALLQARRLIACSRRMDNGADVPCLAFSWVPALLAMAFSLVYAVSDEVHQLFVDGRSSQALDVGIDFAGAALAVVIASLIMRRLLKAKAARPTQD